MIATKQTAYLMTRALPSYLLVVVITIALIFLLPGSQTTMAAYNLSDFEYKIIYFAICLPSFIVWFAAFMGYAKLLEYASTISNTPEGKHYYKLARGGAWLAWSLPLSKITILLLGAIENHWPGFHSAAIIIGNYISLLLPLIAFTLIGLAAKGLVNYAKVELAPSATKAIIVTFITAGLSYCYFVFDHLKLTGLGSSDNGYYLPVWLMLITVIIPYLYMWFIGLLAACDLTLFGTKARGHLYKRALQYLVAGLVIVLVGSIAIQYTGNIQPRAGHLMLNAQLAMILTFRILQGLGFVFITIGAVKLKRIEEV